MDINLHLIPHIHRKKNQNTQEQENTMSEPITINVNDKIEAGKRAIVEAAVNNPEILLIGIGIFGYICYQKGKEKSLMDTMRLAAIMPNN